MLSYLRSNKLRKPSNSLTGEGDKLSSEAYIYSHIYASNILESECVLIQVH